VRIGDLRRGRWQPGGGAAVIHLIQAALESPARGTLQASLKKKSRRSPHRRLMVLSAHEAASFRAEVAINADRQWCLTPISAISATANAHAASRDDAIKH
jgi:hypothetical protein